MASDLGRMTRYSVQDLLVAGEMAAIARAAENRMYWEQIAVIQDSAGMLPGWVMERYFLEIVAGSDF